MTISSNNIAIRPEDGWVSVGQSPIVMGIYPTLKHYWYIAFSDTKPADDDDGAITMGQGKNKLRPFLSQEYSGLMGASQQVWIKIKDPPNSDATTKLNFKIVLAS